MVLTNEHWERLPHKEILLDASHSMEIADESNICDTRPNICDNKHAAGNFRGALLSTGGQQDLAPT